MHANELVDLAALAALEGRELIGQPLRLPDESLQAYWSASRCRLDRWGRGLRMGSLVAEGDGQVPLDLPQLWEEVIESEVLARVAAALFVLHDEASERDEAGPIGRNILHGHIDARRRALGLVSTIIGGKRPNETDFHALFTRCTRWTDLLLGYLVPLGPAEEFAFYPDRAREFAYDSDQHTVDSVGGTTAVSMLRTSLRLALPTPDDDPGFSPELNEQIAAAVVGCFGPELFDAFGLLKSSWLHRMERAAEDTLALVEGLTELPPPKPRWKRD